MTDGDVAAAVIPAPALIEAGEGSFTLTPTAVLSVA